MNENNNWDPNQGDDPFSSQQPDGQNPFNVPPPSAPPPPPVNDYYNNYSYYQAPPPPPPPPPMYGAPNDRRGMAIASMILGIISLVSCCVFYFSLPCAVIGLILGCLSVKSSAKGMAVAGIVCSAVGLCLMAVVLLMILFDVTMDNFYYYW